MKKFLIALLVIFSCSEAGAQLDQGDWLLGGNVGFSLQDRDEDWSRTSFSISPQGGYFVSNKVAVGLLLLLSTTSTESTEFNGTEDITLNDNVTSFAAGPFVRYYYSVSEKLAFMGQAAITYASTTYKDERLIFGQKDESETSSSTISVLLTPGVTYFLSDDIGIDFTMGNTGFRTTTEDNGSTEAQHSDFFVNFNLTNVGLGLWLFLP